jgi:hypothetical protein
MLGPPPSESIERSSKPSSQPPQPRPVCVAHIPFLGFLTLLVRTLVGLGGFIVWIILVIKANQGQMFKLPVIGDLAQQQAGSRCHPERARSLRERRI